MAGAVVLTPIITAAHSGESYVVCNLDAGGNEYLALRSCGSTKCEVLMRMSPDTGLLAIEPYSGNPWREVTVLGGVQMLPIGPDGWVNDKYLCETAD